MSKYEVVRDPEVHRRLLGWWSLLQPEGSRGPSRSGWRAELRRTGTPADVLLTEGFRALSLDLEAQWTQYNRLLPLAAACGIVSHVRTHDGSRSFPEQLAMPAEGSAGRPCMSEMRFARLQRSRDIDELFVRMIRAVHLVRNTANVVSIVDGAMHWAQEAIDGQVETDPRRRFRVSWGLSYFQNLPDTRKKGA